MATQMSNAEIDLINLMLMLNRQTFPKSNDDLFCFIYSFGRNVRIENRLHAPWYDSTTDQEEGEKRIEWIRFSSKGRRKWLNNKWSVVWTNGFFDVKDSKLLLNMVYLLHLTWPMAAGYSMRVNMYGRCYGRIMSSTQHEMMNEIDTIIRMMLVEANA